MVARTRTIGAAITRYCEQRWYLRGLASGVFISVLLALLIAWVDGAGSPTTQRVAETFLIYLVAVVGIQVFMGNAGIVSLGHISFLGLGAYISGLLTTPSALKELSTGVPHAPGFILHAQLGFLPAGLITIVVVAAFATLIGVPLVRLSGGAATIATLSLLVIVETVINNWSNVTRGPQTYFGIPGDTTVGWALAFAVIAIIVARLFRESGIGLRLRATRTDPLVCQAVGVDILRARLVAWVLSAAIAAAAGVLWANYFLALAPQDFYFNLTFSLLVMVIIGGPTVSGAVAGAAGITIVSEILRRRENSGIDVGPIHIAHLFGLTTIVLGLIVVLTMIFRPEGVLGRWELDEWIPRAWHRLRRRRHDDAASGQKAVRHRVRCKRPQHPRAGHDRGCGKSVAYQLRAACTRRNPADREEGDSP